MNEGLLTALAPGLLALVVSRLFSPSERSWDAIATAVYGLALTVIANLCALPGQWGLSWAGMAETSRLSTILVPQFFGAALGLLLAVSLKYNFRSRLLRWWGLPDAESVWLGAFSLNSARYALLNMTNGQRIYGFVRAVSKDVNEGHILLEQASYFTPLGTMESDGDSGQYRGRTLLLRISDVSSIEFYGTIEPSRTKALGVSS